MGACTPVRCVSLPDRPKSVPLPYGNAVLEPWSNGQTEGQINKLKTLKRAMYGRAGVDLLRARMLPLQEACLHQE